MASTGIVSGVKKSLEKAIKYKYSEILKVENLPEIILDEGTLIL